ncbi:MAG: hypothetical protein UV63_C0001G0076 [Microgenomates group bacterium GW2011_GWC1_43_11]|uniref:WbqC-like protein n=2 Tax=Candidatus Gottesmaniibacteriota TaxID=1752720 RepID=A0A0G1IRU1_9BACT|nr:MAG: hypothetical protein UV63_C0001G0076 [Microgenomates group bacterium GW2011_GWC1_43_11]KKT39165.1 MAG: hypothetical protein UW22_C0001G0076 [Candidatus Gottesmanbacteria bacterium GW2011_GWB1_44_11c]KKT61638.1 MAG: hypothetical protein UW52_C0001G0076 [Candidatus Gottesmanbacteria bacterium GW2011_GWA1_44_24b]
MQPYLFPYIGYFQLIHAVDKFVVYDDIEYSKKGWVNRNRILVNGKDQLFTLPLKKDSDYLHISKRKLADNYRTEAKKIFNKINSIYKNAPYYDEVNRLIFDCLTYEDRNLFNFVYHSIREIINFLEIKTELLIFSKIGIKERLKGEQCVIQICKHLKASQYINAIGGVELYNKKIFLKENIKLNFIKSNFIEYKQFDNIFVPWLSIIDIMMFNSTKEIKKMLYSYALI